MTKIIEVTKLSREWAVFMENNRLCIFKLPLLLYLN